MTTAPVAAARAAPPGLGTGRAAVVASLVGFAAMCIELSAVRVLAPHFGDSSFVWTNVIGVMLFALALGAFMGGRIADRGSVAGPLLVVTLGGAGLVGLAAFLARPLAAWLSDPTLPLDAAFGVLVRGSLAATLALFGPPVLLLGAVAPLLVKGLWESGATGVGRAAGAVSAAGTVGSLAGTWLPTHVLVPAVGSRTTLLIAAGCLVLAGGAAWTGRGRRAVVAAALVLLGGAVAATRMDPAPLRAVGTREQLLAEVESPYQYLQVVAWSEADATRRELRINEGYGSFHSVTVVGRSFTEGAYYDLFMMLPALLPDQPLQVASLGSAGGTFQRMFRELFGGRVRVVGVELDAAAVELGRRFLGLADDDRTEIADARQFLQRDRRRFDLVLLDAYRHQIYLPAHLSSVEFFTQVRERLADQGLVALNVGGFTFKSPVVQVVANTLARVFGHAALLRVPGSRNFVLMARNGRRIQRGELTPLAHLPEAVRTAAAKWTGPELWREVDYDAAIQVVTDDRPFLDRLHDRMYSAAGGRP